MALAGPPPQTCKNVKKEYEKAAKNNTVAAYESFLAKCGETGAEPYVEQARERVDGFYFNQAKAAATPRAWKEYFGKTPAAKLLDEALKESGAKPVATESAEALFFDIVLQKVKGRSGDLAQPA